MDLDTISTLKHISEQNENTENKDENASSVLPPLAPLAVPTPKKQLTSMRQSYMCCSRFLLLHKLGKGGFGLIYSGIDLETGREVAIKLEDPAITKKEYLRHEFSVYQKYFVGEHPINFEQNSRAPQVYHYGFDGGFNVLVMDLLGPSLAELFTFKKAFSLKTVCMLAIKTITCVEFLHSRGFIHRDLKPSNFVMGRAKYGNEVFLIDYGLAGIFFDEKNRQHIPFRKNVGFFGTDKFASINSHKGDELSRRDDMESLGYLFIFFLTKNLPWSKKFGNVKKKMSEE